MGQPRGCDPYNALARVRVHAHMQVRTCTCAPTPSMYRKILNSMSEAHKSPLPSPRPRQGTRRIEVRASGVHGKGVFALKDIAAQARVLAYAGELITWAEANERHPRDPNDPNHTFFFHIDAERVIDGGVRGNAARWINHACEPNCEARQVGARVFIHALRPILAGEELFYDYGLVIEGRHTAKLKKAFACRCGAPSCRGTMLAPKR